MSYIDYVNIKQGTRSSMRFSSGNTLPLVQMPFGFVAFAPQTDSTRGSWYYHPEDRSFEGIRLTRQPSPWIGEHGAFTFLPQIQVPASNAGSRWSSFKVKETVLTPCYMRYALNRSFSVVELIPCVYGAKVRLSFQKDYDRFLSVLPVSGFCSYRLDTQKGLLYCMTDCDTFGGPSVGTLSSYVVFQFNPEDLIPNETLTEAKDGTQVKANEISGIGTGIHVALRRKMVEFTVACSYISYEQALKNVESERLPTDFEALKQKNEDVWNEYLGRIEISAEDETMRTFYSCMYRAFLYPHMAHEVGEDGKPIHYAPGLGRVTEGYRYTDNGFWDTYRTNYSFYSIVAEKECRQMVEGYINDYKDYGWFPCWTAGNVKKCMPSTAIDAVICDAAAKGLLSRDLLATAFEGMEKHANLASDLPAFGREGCADYVNLGYVPCDKYRESVNLTLDAAYFDACLANVAERLGYEEKNAFYLNRGKNYKNLFDPSVGFMRPKDSRGVFKAEFSPISWGGDYTEAAAMQTTFAVQHDPDGLAELFGGKEKLLSAVDLVFDSPADFLVGGYGQEIHEMSEMAAVDFGQCAISNQPSFHIPFFHAYFGDRKTTTERVHALCREVFSYRDNGFPGDEDNGSMAIWYIFACIGLYPFCPGKPYYTCHTPYVSSVKVHGCKLSIPESVSKISHQEIVDILAK
ncbi:MAG: GH92 family glycosyl hydrolase [Clostridia bacterium]|nr:GH92 family glycosyl hydrolase [Clostridia bacterium]